MRPGDLPPVEPGEAYPGEFAEFKRRRPVHHVAVGSVGAADGHEEVTLDLTLEGGKTIYSRLSPGVARIAAGAMESAVKSIEEQRTRTLRRRGPSPEAS